MQWLLSATSSIWCFQRNRWYFQRLLGFPTAAQCRVTRWHGFTRATCIMVVHCSTSRAGGIGYDPERSASVGECWHVGSFPSRGSQCETSTAVTCSLLKASECKHTELKHTRELLTRTDCCFRGVAVAFAASRSLCGLNACGAQNCAQHVYTSTKRAKLTARTTAKSLHSDAA